MIHLNERALMPKIQEFQNAFTKIGFRSRFNVKFAEIFRNAAFLKYRGGERERERGGGRERERDRGRERERERERE